MSEFEDLTDELQESQKNTSKFWKTSIFVDFLFWYKILSQIKKSKSILQI